MISVIARIHKYLETWPNEIISIALVVVGVVTVIVGIFAPVEIKALWLAYEVLP